MLQPENFQLEQTTVWSFPKRGSWATHSGKYRGNWSPYVPRNLITRYTKPGEWVLDQFSGSGTTLVEAKLLDRNAVGVDINPEAVALAERNLNFTYEGQGRILVKQGDATKLSIIKDEKIDFICTHPPYENIIKYSEDIAGDISLLDSEHFWLAMGKAAKEAYRVLKKGKYCAVMIGDRRNHGNVVPLGFKLMETFLQAGFKLKEIIIKDQHNCMSSPKWQSVKRNFLLLAHEYIFVFYKR